MCREVDGKWWRDEFVSEEERRHGSVCGEVQNKEEIRKSHRKKKRKEELFNFLLSSWVIFFTIHIT